MANFYTEVPELKYHLNNSMMERICELKERGYQDKDKYDYAPQDYADAMRALFSPAVIGGWAVVTMIVACIGGLIGRFLLRKHFAKAGVA